jgi:hypothetical protein
MQVLPDDWTPTVISPLAAIPKPGPTGLDDDIREIWDLTASGINDACKVEVMWLPNLDDAARLFGPRFYAAKFDLMDGFFHLRVHPKHVMLLAARFPISGKIGVQRCLVFGYKRAPFLFQGTAIEMRKLLMRLGLTEDSVVYIDDWLMTAQSKEECDRNMELFITEMTRMGWIIKASKTIASCQVIDFTGVCINSITGYASVTERKRLKALGRVDAILRADKVVVKEAESLIGFLCHISELVKGGRLAYRPLMEAKDKILGHQDKWGRRLRGSQVISLSTDMRVGLAWWRDILSDPDRCKLKLWLDEKNRFRLWRADLVPRWDMAPKRGCATIFSDASNTGFAFHMGRPDAPVRIIGGLWTWSQTTNSINWKESKAILLSLSSYQADLFEQFIVSVSDNVSAVAEVNKLDSKAAALGHLGMLMRERLMALLAQALAVHIPGYLNTGADPPSRAGEWLWAKAVISPCLVKRVERVAGRSVVCLGEVQAGRLGLPVWWGDKAAPDVLGPTLWVPPPHRTDLALKAVRSSKGGAHLVLMMEPLGSLR